MAVTVKKYLSYFRESNYPALFSRQDIDRLENVEKIYGDIETDETILEICLSEEKTGCDYSIRKAVDSPYVKEYWYELDGDACGKEDIPACYFVDATKVIPGKDNCEFYENVLVKLAGRERVDKLRHMLDLCVDKLEGKCKNLYQIGSMTGRMELDRIRLFTDDMTKDDIVSYLKELKWNGNTEKLCAFLSVWEPYSDKRKFILDFDILEDRISEKIGINFGTPSKKIVAVKSFLETMENVGLCMSRKKEDVLRFIERFPCHTPFIQNDISHFKIPFMGGEPLRAKAYLREGSVCFCNDYRAYDTPALMNLELTTKCPLRCPQCYCDLSGGKDMDIDTALYWLEEAAANNVRNVNLSGGETMMYPHLEKLIQTCHTLGMEANVALSGYGVDRAVLERLVDCGVSDICISLNGSTNDVNSLSRDGYNLAVKALQILDDMGYPRTCINWVMHSNNADDFENMIQLAERYHVACIAVMVFKPDATHQRPSIPSAEQIYKVAKLIKEYKGNVKIEAEECFSQMRAILGKRFFVNLNCGVSRGCGAGRDSISISVDGKITPCRHLEIKEEFRSIREYWYNSEIVRQLRQVEDRMKKPCGECHYNRNCLPCMAVNWKMNGEIYMGDESCTLYK
jgi:pyrroloquinoline quinone biosynthesis protein E